VIEDFSGTHEFILFSDKYLKFKHYLEQGNIMYMNWSTKKNYRDPDALEIEINSMGVLADLKDKYTQITLQVLENEISEQFVNELVAVFEKHPGKSAIRMIIMTVDPAQSVQTLSSMRVDTNSDFLKELGQLIGDRYKLN
jgi:DNA polymerase-3 subunit alpha